VKNEWDLAEEIVPVAAAAVVLTDLAAAVANGLYG
jgi:hypothetical protein